MKFAIKVLVALSLLASPATTACGQSRTAEMVQPMPNGFRVTSNLGFRQKDRYLYYWFENSARNSDETLMRYDTRTRSRKKVFGPLGHNERQEDSVLSPSGKLLYFGSNSRALKSKHKLRGRNGKYFLDTRTGLTESLVLSRKPGAACFEGSRGGCRPPVGLGFSVDDETFYYLTFHLIEAAPALTSDGLPALVAYARATGIHSVIGERVVQHDLFRSEFTDIETEILGQSVAIELRNRSTRMDEDLGEVVLEPGSVLYPPNASPIMGAPQGDGAYRYQFSTGILQPIKIQLNNVAPEKTGVSCGQIVPNRNQYFVVASSFSRGNFERDKAECFISDLLTEVTTPFTCKSLPSYFDESCSSYDLVVSPNGRFVIVRSIVKGRIELLRYDLTSGNTLLVTAPLISTFHTGQYGPRFAAMSSTGAMVAFTDGSSSYVGGDKTVDDLFLIRIKG